MMSARAGLRPGTFLRLSSVSWARSVTRWRICAGDAEAPHRLASLAFAGHDHRRQCRERAARAVEHAGDKRQLADAALEHAVDVFAELLELIGRRHAGGVALFGDADRTERRGVDLIDQSARGEDDFGAASADVGHRHLATRDVERPLHAQEREPSFFVRRDHFDVEVELAMDTLAKLGAILGISDGAGGNRRDAGDAVADGDRLEAAKRRNRGVDRGVRKFAGGDHRRRQPSVLALFVEHAVAARGQHLGHDQPHAVRADVDRGDARSRRGSAVAYGIFGIHHDICPERPNRELPTRLYVKHAVPEATCLPNTINICWWRWFVKGSCRSIVGEA